MILVTGGTGLVGSHLLLRLVQQGHRVRAVHRPSSDLQAVQKIFSYYVGNSADLFARIEWVLADLNDIPALETAFTGVTKVYHAAALISFTPKDFEKLLKNNVAGTANIVNLCIANAIEKLCYVSSIAAIGNSLDGTPVTEEDEFNPQHADVYARSKYAAELEVWRGSQEGVPVVIVNPGVIIGPGFWEGGSGALFSTAQNGYSYYPPSGTGFVTVTDVVDMMIELMDSTIEKERFIAVSENLSYREILSLFAKNLNLKPPSKPLKIWHLKMLRILDVLRHLIFGKKRLITKDGIESLKQRTYYDNQKIGRHLDFDFEPVADTIAFSCNLFMEENPS